MDSNVSTSTDVSSVQTTTNGNKMGKVFFILIVIGLGILLYFVFKPKKSTSSSSQKGGGSSGNTLTTCYSPQANGMNCIVTSTGYGISCDYTDIQTCTSALSCYKCNSGVCSLFSTTNCVGDGLYFMDSNCAGQCQAFQCYNCGDDNTCVLNNNLTQQQCIVPTGYTTNFCNFGCKDNSLGHILTQGDMIGLTLYYSPNKFIYQYNQYGTINFTNIANAVSYLYFIPIDTKSFYLQRDDGMFWYLNPSNNVFGFGDSTTASIFSLSDSSGNKVDLLSTKIDQNQNFWTSRQVSVTDHIGNSGTFDALLSTNSYDLVYITNGTGGSTDNFVYIDGNNNLTSSGSTFSFYFSLGIPNSLGGLFEMYKNGIYLINYNVSTPDSIYYLTNSNGSLKNTSDKNSATKWTFSSMANSTFFISSGDQYMNYGGDNVVLKDLDTSDSNFQFRLTSYDVMVLTLMLSTMPIYIKDNSAWKGNEMVTTYSGNNDLFFIQNIEGNKSLNCYGGNNNCDYKMWGGDKQNPFIFILDSSVLYSS